MNKSIIPFIVIASALVSCSKYVDGYIDYNYGSSTEGSFVTLNNYSSDATVWYIPDLEHASALPETLTEWQKTSVYEVDAHSSFTVWFDSTDGYVTPEETYGVSDTMPFYVFKKSDWDAFTWQELVQDQMWAGVRNFTVQQMIDADSNVIFPFL